MYSVILDAINIDESFSIDEVEQREIEQVALIPNLDNATVCSCKGTCLRAGGRNACPCESIEQYCSSACHSLGGTNSKICLNNRKTLESDSSESDSEGQYTVSCNIYIYKYSRLYKRHFLNGI